MLRTCLVALALALPSFSTVAQQPVLSREEWFRGLDLEQAAAAAELILAVRVENVSEIRLVFGGKGESSMLQFKLKPLRVLKGVYARDELALTGADLGGSRIGAELKRLKPGQTRLLFLARSDVGYMNVNRESTTLDLFMPPLRDENDPLLEAVRTLLAVVAEHDRSKRVAKLIETLDASSGPAVIPLLESLRRRALIAAQNPGVAKAVTRHLASASPATRGLSAIALEGVLEADYLDQAQLRQDAAAALVAALEKAGANLGARIALIEATGGLGASGAINPAIVARLKPVETVESLAEQRASIEAAGKLKLINFGEDLFAIFARLPLDSPNDWAIEVALCRIDPGSAGPAILRRITRKLDTGLEFGSDIWALATLPADTAVPLLLKISELSLNRSERSEFARTCAAVTGHAPDERLVPSLAILLDPDEPDLRAQAIDALFNITTPAAAKALQPHLHEEKNLDRKLKIAAFLGRHGIRDGYPYAIEHMSEPRLLDQAVAALAAIKDPRATSEAKKILESSNDARWNSASIRVLGAMGAKELAPRFLEIVGDWKNPLAPAALIALGDLGELGALAKVREGFLSRNNEIVRAAARAAGKLLAQPDIATDDIRDQLASLLEDADASEQARQAALDSLVTLKDTRLDRALGAAVKDAGLEGSDLLRQIEKLLRERKVAL